MSETAADTSVAELVAEVARLRDEVAAATKLARRAADRGEIENLFNRYMYLHNAFQDERIIPLWVKRGTDGIRARYTNAGQYTDYDSVIRYHQGRPAPEGKLILHSTTTPVIEVATDGETAKGVWLMAGTEHAIDFLRQNGEWRIWKFRCYELARAPFEENWVSFGEKNQGAFDLDLMYFGDDGKPVFMPKADEPVPSENHPYSPTTVQKLEPEPPVPFDTFVDTFK